jgi:transcriptional regulator with XRE-family HTH domain
MEFEIVGKAGLTQSEFAKLCGVSRVTANLWLNGKMKPHRLLTLAVAKRLDLLQEAVTSGDLPLDRNVLKRDRERQLYTIVTNAALRVKQRATEAAEATTS